MDFKIIGLIIILLLTLTMPFISKKVEHNLEYFLFAMGLASTIVARVLNGQFLMEVFQNKLIYMITGAVLIAGLLFKLLQDYIKGFVDAALKHISLKVFVFILIFALGLLSSVITAIIASLLLVEIVSILPLDKKSKVNIDIIACFSIGLGAVLTPIGEPLATIVESKLKQGFWFLFNDLGIYILPGIIALSILGVYFVAKNTKADGEEALEEETYKGVFIRAFKIFIFIIALEFLGSGFKVVIDTYVIKLDGRILYWLNMLSAILDNATLAAAEISIRMHPVQIKAVLLGLLISGGMLIPGNIPNIISAGKLKIESKEWAKLGVPLGLIMLIIYYVVLFVI